MVAYFTGGTGVSHHHQAIGLEGLRFLPRGEKTKAASAFVETAKDRGAVFKVCLVEDDPNSQELFVHFMQKCKRLELVGAYATGPEALQELPKVNPDVVLMDIKLPGMSGIECVKALRRLSLPCVSTVLMLTDYDDDKLILDSLKAGANGYLLKRHTAGKELEAAIVDVMTGGGPMSRSIARKLIACFQTSQPREGEHPTGPREPTNAFSRESQRTLEHRPNLRPRDESSFIQEGDYWTIIYQGQVARLKDTRGLHCLAYLLRHPGREFHVSELLVRLPEVAEPRTPAHLPPVSQCVRCENVSLILDAQAKAEYKRRLEELREDLADAEQRNASDQVSRAHEEMNIIAEHLAAAVGLGGRDRGCASISERARSAVTKRIKMSIHKIEEAMPSLGRHLAARIKTGYFCSYHPHPDRPVTWRF